MGSYYDEAPGEGQEKGSGTATGGHSGAPGLVAVATTFCKQEAQRRQHAHVPALVLHLARRSGRSGTLPVARTGVGSETPQQKASTSKRDHHYFFYLSHPPARGGEQQPQQQQRTQLRSARARQRGGRSSALRAGAGAGQPDCGESERAVSGQCVWGGAQRPTQRPRTACPCPALLREYNQQQTEIGAF